MLQDAHELKGAGHAGKERLYGDAGRRRSGTGTRLLREHARAPRAAGGPGAISQERELWSCWSIRRSTRAMNQATAASWAVGDDFDSIVQDLRTKGVNFEHYDDLPRQRARATSTSWTRTRPCGSRIPTATSSTCSTSQCRNASRESVHRAERTRWTLTADWVTATLRLRRPRYGSGRRKRARRRARAARPSVRRCCRGGRSLERPPRGESQAARPVASRRHFVRLATPGARDTWPLSRGSDQETRRPGLPGRR